MLMLAEVRRILALGLLVAALVPGAAFAQTNTQASFGQVISALNNINAQVNQLNALNNLTVQDIRLVNINDTLNGNNVQALNNALNRNNVQIVNLQNVLNNLTVRDVLNNNQILNLTDVLNNNNVALNRVVAIDVLSGGGLTLFYL
jgi:hypothetical protein